MNIDFGRAVLAGIVGTVVMTLVALFVAPLMGLPASNPANLLAAQMGGMMIAGWIAHFMIGVILAVIYAAVAPALPGPPALRGALYGLAPWLLAMVAVMPIIGMSMFGGAAPVAIASLVGHLVYGAVVGAVYGEPAPAGTGATV